ncbi:transmembrane protein, putative (macronuclear) [Tetrahymena thermophila SB210]|uniref:Transmembrane protein, putative n=1 Tax=Tetrahymena thermophila (strain SB210) TaxID=312017 RepID=Q24BW5_TETTS|nr:transmembrane protein, putative [Tetrahymena thermophila SB210]EAS05272.3 transmembrane protein, putative [Tetrahymena thermophila SB210]|eukprot:XP_001025517.3 transmembrane protein, putative [Tetrahymena thermophila SB210]
MSQEDLQAYTNLLSRDYQNDIPSSSFYNGQQIFVQDHQIFKDKPRNCFKEAFLAEDELSLLLTENQITKLVFYIVVWFFILLSISGYILSFSIKDQLYDNISVKIMSYLEIAIAIILLAFYYMVQQIDSYSRSSIVEKLYKLRRIILILFIITYLSQLSLSIYSLIQTLPEWIGHGININLSAIIYIIVSVSIISKIFYFCFYLVLELTFKSEY